MKPDNNKKIKASDEEFEDLALALVLSILMKTLDANDLSKLSDVRGNRRYRIVFEISSGLGRKIQSRLYTDDAEVMAKLATLVQQRIKVKDLRYDVSISFETTFGGKNLYGKLYAFAHENAWSAVNSSGRRKDGCYEFDFFEPYLLDDWFQF